MDIKYNKMKQIVKQPDGKYCLFSSTIDNITHCNMTPEDIVEVLLEEEKKKIEDFVFNIIKGLEMGGKPYSGFTKTYKDVLKDIERVHGKKQVEEIKKLIEQ